MSNTKKICSVLIAADGPMTQPEIAKRTGLSGQTIGTALWGLANAGVLKKAGERGSFTYEVANVDEAKKRAAGDMKSGRKPKGEASAEKPAKAKRRKSVKTKPTKRRRAVKRVERAPARPDPQLYMDQDGALQIIDRENEDIAIRFTRAQAWKLAMFLVAQRVLIEPKKGRKGARR